MALLYRSGGHVAVSNPARTMEEPETLVELRARLKRQGHGGAVAMAAPQQRDELEFILAIDRFSPLTAPQLLLRWQAVAPAAISYLLCNSTTHLLVPSSCGAVSLRTSRPSTPCTERVQVLNETLRTRRRKKKSGEN